MKAMILAATLCGLATAANALTAEQQAAVNLAGWRLTVAYHCAPAINDAKPYARAKADVPKILADAGVTSPTAAEMIAAVERQDQGTTSPGPRLCRDLLTPQ